MIKRGRPYSIGNGWVDDSLLTDKPVETQVTVLRWIRENIRPARSICVYTSYGLKHVLQQDIGVYLTNNEFKDAMHISGYAPIDSDELNWRYRIKCISEAPAI